MKTDYLLQRRRHVPLRYEPDVTVLSACPIRLTLVALPYAFGTPVTLVLQQRLSRSLRSR
jgi:hypothetical protein